MDRTKNKGANAPEIDHGLELAEGEIFTGDTLAELTNGKGDDEDE